MHGPRGGWSGGEGGRCGFIDQCAVVGPTTLVPGSVHTTHNGSLDTSARGQGDRKKRKIFFFDNFKFYIKRPSSRGTIQTFIYLKI